MNRAGKNPWILAKLTDLELELSKMVQTLTANKKTFRIERVPLCYMQGFEEFCTETRKIVKDEKYICSFIEKDRKNELRISGPKHSKNKADVCSICFLNKICSGLDLGYISFFGTSELYPIFKSPNKIINEILNNVR